VSSHSRSLRRPRDRGRYRPGWSVPEALTQYRRLLRDAFPHPANIPRSESRHTSFIGAPPIDATDSGAGSVTPSPMGRDQDLASLVNGSRLLAGPFPNDVVISAPARYVRGRRLTLRWLARTRDVSVLCPRVLGADNKTCPFAVLFVSPLTDSNRRPPPTMEVFDRLQQLAEKAEAR
jgi:hypothetical protein